MIPEHDLRVATALAHALPRSLTELHFDDGRVLRVSHEPAFRPILDPCVLRKAVVALTAGHPAAPLWLERVVRVEIGGPFVEHLGADAWLAWCGGTEVACFATVLDHGRVVELLESAGDHDERVAARVCPDLDLGVTLVTVEPEPPVVTGRMVDVLRELQAICLTDELLAAVR
jgi:hypothetical protein